MAIPDVCTAQTTFLQIGWNSPVVGKHARVLHDLADAANGEGGGRVDIDQLAVDDRAQHQGGEPLSRHADVDAVDGRPVDLIRGIEALQRLSDDPKFVFLQRRVLWHGDLTGEPVPGTQEQFGALITAWIGTGAHCPQ